VQPSGLAAAAGARALDRAGIDAAHVDTVLFCGMTRDFIEPGTSNVVAATLGATKARVLDVTNACNGIIDGVDLADSLIRTGKSERVLVTAGERFSNLIAWNTRTVEQMIRTVAGLVFSDGGGALLVEASDDPGRGLRERVYRSAPEEWQLAVGGRFRPSDQACEVCGSVVDMPFLCDGRKLFEVGFPMMRATYEEVLRRTGWEYDKVDFVFSHEASKRFVDDGMERLGSDKNPGPKLWSTAARFGNTSTFSLPLQMAEALDAGALRPGAKVLMLGGAAGVTMAAVTMVW